MSKKKCPSCGARGKFLGVVDNKKHFICRVCSTTYCGPTRPTNQEHNAVRDLELDIQLRNLYSGKPQI